ncbi:hypothetical protein J421_0228 [Gemmatirosa kalamazoonensis]|uniref:Uncharacterized protein n=2 Tax=Gemmatirosa kalamazoonensis TaxID=861299 RepID=W0RBS8_9BACT|nr:hypothetical protein J421_0228 [Gemmatirosa kalamazoonensis]
MLLVAWLLAGPAAGAQSSRPSTGVAGRAAFGAKEDDYEPKGLDACVFDDAATKAPYRCVGWARSTWNPDWKKPQSRAVAAWIRDTVPYFNYSQRVAREPKTGTGPGPQFRIAMTWDAEFVPLSKLKQRALVVARIEADGDPNAPEDKLFGINRRGTRLEREFYLVIEPFRFDGTGQPPANPVQHKVSQWHVYGVDAQTRELVPVGNSRSFYRCDHAHDGDEKMTGAAFMTCDGMRMLALKANSALLREPLDRYRATLPVQRSRTDALLQWVNGVGLDATTLPQRLAEFTGVRDKSSPAIRRDAADLARLLRNQPSDPGWMTCGLGCCVAAF